MTDNLKLALIVGKNVDVVNNSDGNLVTGGWTPEALPTGVSSTSDSAYSMNGNTIYYSGTTSLGITVDDWFYSWYAATAVTNEKASKAASMVTSDGDALYSICPERWRLPTNYVNSTSDMANKSYGSLLLTYGISPDAHTSYTEYQILESFPLNFERKGHVYSGTFQVGSGAGVYRSSTPSSNSVSSYVLNYAAQYVDASINNAKYQGFLVRCVAI